MGIERPLIRPEEVIVSSKQEVGAKIGRKVVAEREQNGSGRLADKQGSQELYEPYGGESRSHECSILNF